MCGREGKVKGDRRRRGLPLRVVRLVQELVEDGQRKRRRRRQGTPGRACSECGVVWCTGGRRNKEEGGEVEAAKTLMMPPALLLPRLRGRQPGQREESRNYFSPVSVWLWSGSASCVGVSVRKPRQDEEEKRRRRKRFGSRDPSHNKALKNEVAWS